MAIKRLGAVSAYAIAVEHGYTGTETEWIASLKGVKGDKGEPGAKGDSYIITEADKTEIADEVESKYTTELGEIKADFTTLQTLVGDEPASEESGLELLKTVSDSIELYGALVGIIENLPSDESAQELVAELNNENDILSKIVEDM